MIISHPEFDIIIISKLSILCEYFLGLPYILNDMMIFGKIK